MALLLPEDEDGNCFELEVGVVDDPIPSPDPLDEDEVEVLSKALAAAVLIALGVVDFILFRLFNPLVEEAVVVAFPLLDEVDEDSNEAEEVSAAGAEAAALLPLLNLRECEDDDKFPDAIIVSVYCCLFVFFCFFDESRLSRCLCLCLCPPIRASKTRVERERER